ncbi:hypothetical protein [Allorhizocola rhizosphaerae]|uniref:hypothetical protein n=1 Tax=Allorhizocola rhizosphaerae TaxID=1872709 RepID=UPI000E3D0B39|nr:hypothetical protein [Allorhizocola rhizosphaerae]
MSSAWPWVGRPQAIMAMLIARRNRPVSLDELIAATWDHSPGSLGPDSLGQQRFRLHDLVRQFATGQAVKQKSTLERADDKMGIACGLTMLVATYSSMGGLDAAEAHASDALAAAEATGNAWLAEMLGLRGNIFSRRVDIPRQRQVLERAVELHLAADELVNTGRRLTSLGEAAAHVGDHAAAAEYFERGVALLRRMPASVPLA